MSPKQRVKLLGRSFLAMGFLSAAVTIGRVNLPLFYWHYRPLVLAGSGIAIAASLGILFRKTPWLLVGAVIGVAPVLWHFRDFISSSVPF